MDAGWATIMSLRALLLVLSCALPIAAVGAERDDALLHCRALSDSAARLNCYDAIAVAQPTASDWSGRNGTGEFAFSAQAGDDLQVEHDDVILVGALKDTAGKLLENLHLAGRGTLRYKFSAAGDYIVTLSATGDWRARLKRAP